MYSSITPDDWCDLPGTTNPVESINHQNVPQNVNSVSLRPLVEHIYVKDRRQAVLEVATRANISITYNTKKTKDLQTSETT